MESESSLGGVLWCVPGLTRGRNLTILSQFSFFLFLRLMISGSVKLLIILLVVIPCLAFLQWNAGGLSWSAQEEVSGLAGVCSSIGEPPPNFLSLITILGNWYRLLQKFLFSYCAFEVAPWFLFNLTFQALRVFQWSPGGLSQIVEAKQGSAKDGCQL